MSDVDDCQEDERASGSCLQPFRDAVEVEGVLTSTADHATLSSRKACLSFTLNARNDQHVVAN